MSLQLYPLYPILYQGLKPLFPQCLWQGNPDQKAIALTFDDGPHPQYTPELLNVLETYNVKANFFWLGYWVEQYPEIAKAVYNRGHWIGLHGYTHRNFPQLTPEQLYQDLYQTQTAILQACDLNPEERSHFRDVRPPNGIFTPQTLKLLQQWNYRPVMWTVVPEDWVNPGVATVVKRIVETVCPGSLIVLHDGIYGGQSVAETIKQILPILLEQDYKLVSINHLWHSLEQ